MAVKLEEELSDALLVTTDEVLTEFLTGISKKDSRRRLEAVEIVHKIMQDPNIKVIPQTHDSFMNGINRYKQRHDKSCSLQDCISMNVMEDESMEEILTRDHDFEQEKFIILMKRNSGLQT